MSGPLQTNECLGSKESKRRGLLENWGIKDKISTFIMTNDYGSVADYLKSHIQGNKETGLNGSLFHGFPVRCCGKMQGLKLWTMGEYSRKEITNFHDVPSPEEWNKVEGVCKIVGSIYEVSNALFETNHLTANVYLYHLHELREILYQMTIQSDGFIRTIAEAMLKKLGKYWDEIFLLLAITAALDPRFKMKYIEFVCSKVKGDASTQVLAVWRAIQKQFDEYRTRFPEEETFLSDSSSSDSDSEEEPPPIPLHVNHIFSVLQDYHQCIQLSNQPTKKSDLDYCLEEPILPWSQKFSALTWWKTAGAKYPTLSRMARDFLGIPVSLATSYDAFYTEPRPVDEHMIRLKPNLANALMCTRSWCS
ncbi:hypothetical protein M0R45_021206 [Rubus argutus]|uniref:Uncharacterized protein n=1 Tax=Rubus argutus TaxID=59490 RepID=A0AAW1XCG1_RUBAR